MLNRCCYVNALENSDVILTVIRPGGFSDLAPAKCGECDCRPTRSLVLRLGPVWRSNETVTHTGVMGNAFNRERSQ